MKNPKKSTGHFDMQETVLIPSDKGKKIEVHTGDMILVRLDENPTTGYQWKVGELDPQIIELQDTQFSMAPETGIGGGGIKIFTFKAKSCGTVKVQLKLKREWEPEDALIDHFKVTISVKGGPTRVRPHAGDRNRF